MDYDPETSPATETEKGPGQVDGPMAPTQEELLKVAQEEFKAAKDDVQRVFDKALARLAGRLKGPIKERGQPAGPPGPQVHAAPADAPTTLTSTTRTGGQSRGSGGVGLAITMPIPEFCEKRSTTPADAQEGYDPKYAKVINGGDLPPAHDFLEIPTEGPRTNNLAGLDAFYDQDAFLQWVRGLRWQAPDDSQIGHIPVGHGADRSLHQSEHNGLGPPKTRLASGGRCDKGTGRDVAVPRDSQRGGGLERHRLRAAHEERQVLRVPIPANAKSAGVGSCGTAGKSCSSRNGTR